MEKPYICQNSSNLTNFFFRIKKIFLGSFFKNLGGLRGQISKASESTQYGTQIEANNLVISKNSKMSHLGSRDVI